MTRLTKIAAILVLLIGAGSAWADLTDGLVAHWKFDEETGVTAYDSVGSSHGTLINGPIWTTGQIEGALEFDGVNDYISCGTGPALTGTGPLSASAWVKTDTAKGQAIVVQRSETTANGSYGTSILADGRVQFWVYNGGYGFLFQSSVTVNDGLWHHVAVVRTNSTDGQIYVDGSLVGSDSGPVKSVNYVPVWIGGPGFTGPFCFDGKIDDVRIYNRALSAAEIEQLYLGEELELVGLEISGPDEVAEDSQTQYSAIALYDNNSTSDVTDSAVWSVEPNTLAAIDENGLLTTQPINYLTEDITIYAQYTEDSNTVDAEKPVSVLAICPTGTALEFDGVDDYVEVNSPDILNFGSSIDFTFAAWINAETVQIKHPAIIGRRNLSDAHGYIFFLHSYEKLAVQLNDGIHSNYISTGPDLRDDTWHHVAATGDRDGYLIFYIDGVQAGQNDISGKGNIDSTANLYIGWEERHSTVTYFNGIIDEVAIYNRALSAEEIQENVHNTLTGAEPNLIAYWPFDEGEGQVAYDLSPYANHGRLGSDPNADDSDPAWVDSDAPIGICTADQLIERHVTDALQIKQNILAELDAALTKEHAAFYILQELFINPDNVDLTKRQILMLRQLIRLALQDQQRSEKTLQDSIEKLEDASVILDGDNNVNAGSAPKRQLQTLGKPAATEAARKPSRN